MIAGANWEKYSTLVIESLSPHSLIPFMAETFGEGRKRIGARGAGNGALILHHAVPYRHVGCPVGGCCCRQLVRCGRGYDRACYQHQQRQNRKHTTGAAKAGARARASGQIAPKQRSQKPEGHSDQVEPVEKSVSHIIYPYEKGQHPHMHGQSRVTHRCCQWEPLGILKIMSRGATVYSGSTTTPMHAY